MDKEEKNEFLKAYMKVVIDQLGGNGFARMVGLKKVLYSFNENNEPTVFLYAAGLRRRAPFTISLNTNDLYDLTYGKTKETDVYAEQLQDFFKDMTGLDTVFPFIIR